MSNSKVDEIRKRLDDAIASSVSKQHQKGRLSFFERIERLVDEGSFQEIGSFIGNLDAPGVSDISRDAVMTGFGRVQGKTVVIASQDFSQKGGTLGLMHSKKIVHAMEIAVRTRCPFIFIGDSGGARIQEGVDALAGFGDIFHANVQASGVIPQIAVILGPCAGGAVYSPALMDFVFMVDKLSYMFVTGPKVVKEVTGEEISTENLGGARIHSFESGVSGFYCEDEESCFKQVKKLLSFICDVGKPSDMQSCKPLLTNREMQAMRSKRIREVIPEAMNKPYDVRKIISEIADDSDYLEVFKDFALNIFTGFVRIDGRTVGVIANNPSFIAGTLDANSSCKAARFIRFCDSFGIPLLTLVDVPGYMPGSMSEREGIIRHGAKMLYAYSESTVPKVTLVMRKAFGGAYIAMCSKHLGADIVYAYPESQIAVMGAEGAVDVLYSKQIEAAEDPSGFRNSKLGEYEQALMNPVIAAKRGYVDEIIDMQDTRGRIVNAFRMLAQSGKSGSSGFRHGNIPL